MKRRCILLLLTVVVAGLLPAASQGAERWKVLKAINWVENPTNHTKYGPKGELGPYQFRASTWKDYSKLPFSYAVKREHADEVAVRHYEWIKQGLINAGIDPSPYNIALVWNSGLGAVTSGRIPKSTYRYAEQVHNLVEVLQRQTAQQRAERVAATETKVAPIAVPNLTLDLPPIHFVRTAEASAPKFVIEDIATEEIPTIVTDKSPTVATKAPSSEQAPFFVATALAAPRFRLVD